MTTIDFFSAKKRLAMLWFIGSGLIVFLVILQTLHHKFEGGTQDAWGWLFPNILPVLSLILSVFLLDINNVGTTDKQVPLFFLRLSSSIASVYLLVILIVIVMAAQQGNVVKNLQAANIFLGPLQGLAISATGLFFSKAK